MLALLDRREQVRHLYAAAGKTLHFDPNKREKGGGRAKIAGRLH